MTRAGSIQAAIDRFRQMPRAIQWLAIAGTGIILFMLWADQIQAINDKVVRKADRIEEQVRTVRQASGLSQELRSLEDTIRSVGPVNLPGSPDEGYSQLQQVVNDVLAEHRVSAEKFDTRPQGKLKRGVLDRVTGGARIETIQGDLTFEVTPEDAVAIVAELESSRAVQRVTSVQLRKIKDGKVNVRLLLEAWVRSTGD